MINEQDETRDQYHEASIANDANYGEHVERMHEPMPATSILALMDTTKAQRRTFAEQVVQAIEDGNVNPLLIHCQIKAMENLLKQFTDSKEGGELRERYMNSVLDEAQKNGKNFEYHSGKFTIKEAGQKYDYSQCGDAELLRLMNEQALREADIKDRQEYLKKIPSKGINQVDPDTGEMFTLYPPSVTSTTTVSVTLK